MKYIHNAYKFKVFHDPKNPRAFVLCQLESKSKEEAFQSIRKKYPKAIKIYRTFTNSKDLEVLEFKPQFNRLQMYKGLTKLKNEIEVYESMMDKGKIPDISPHTLYLEYRERFNALHDEAHKILLILPNTKSNAIIEATNHLFEYLNNIYLRIRHCLDMHVDLYLTLHPNKNLFDTL